MKKSRVVLAFEILLAILTVISSLCRIHINKKNIYKEKYYVISGIVDKIEIDTKIKIEFKDKKELTGYYYFKGKEEKEKIINNISLGDEISVSGKISKYNKSYYINIEKIYLKKKNTNYFYYIKNKILNSSNPYIPLFILGDKSKINKSIIKKYRNIGISHLFAISGMHISLLVKLISKILKKIINNKKYILLIINTFLFLYLVLVGITPSVLRAVLFYFLFSIDSYHKLFLKKMDIFIISLFISLLINPFFIYDISFLYSFVISFSLIYYSNYIKNKNYFKSIVITSLIATLYSFPITIYNFNEINILSIIYNTIFIPLISIIIFPFAIITYFLPVLVPILDFLTNLLENLVNVVSRINSNVIFMKLPIVMYFIYYLILIILKNNKIELLICLTILIIIYYNIPNYYNTKYINVIDVGQGDSILIHHNKTNILIDTGGKLNSDYSIVDNKTIPLLKRNGIKSISFLVISHGDFDHMGEAINLVNNFKVEKVIFNCGPYNNLEKELIKVLDRKKIKYYSCIKELNIDNNKLYFLQTSVYDNENDNSNVIYTELDGYKFMFMGDASIKTEQEILDKYNLPDIDVLKVGHHGSKTSSSREFINEVNPNYSIISVGKNNRYGHPNKEVLDNLKNSKIYRTDEDGSIMFKIKNKKLKIETCSP